MLIVVFKYNGTQMAELFPDVQAFNHRTGSPNTEVIETLSLNLSLKGLQFLTAKRTPLTAYEKKRVLLREKAIEWQRIESENPFSLQEYSAICGWFENQGRRYGMLTEFRENAIC